MKKWLLFLAVAIAVSVWTYVREQASSFGPSAGRKYVPNRRVSALPQRRASMAPIVVSGDSALEVTKRYLDENREELRIQEHHAMTAEEFRTPLGTSVTYRFTQDGLPIVGLSLSFRLDRDLRIVEIENEYRPLEKADLDEPALPVAQLMAETAERYDLAADPSLEVGKVLYAHPASLKPHVAVTVPMKEPSRHGRGVLMLLRASDGQLLQKSYSRGF